MNETSKKQSLFKSGVSQRIFLPIGILMLAVISILSALSVATLNNTYEQVVTFAKDGFDSDIRIAVETIIGSLQANHQAYLDGQISQEEEMIIAKDIVRNAWYSSAPGKDDDGYFWADMANGLCVVHYNPANEGAMRINAQDSEGTYFVQNCVEQGDAGGGYSDFYFGKPGDEQGSYKKRGYTQKFEPYGWYVSTGNYYEDIDKTIADVEAKKFSTYLLIFGMSILAILVTFLVTFFIAKSIADPIHKITDVLHKVAMGDLNVNAAMNTKDEIGMLSRDVGKVIDIINGLIADLTNMEIMHNEKGEIGVFVDEKKFPGQFGDVVKSTNDMVTGHINTKKLAMSVLAKMASGDFEVPMEKLPGKKIFITEAIEEMRKHIKNVDAEITEMISEALKGNLSVKANADHFDGGWAEIMEGLNKLLGSITTPVIESSKVLQEMAKGNLNTKVTGNFKGDLALLSNSLNSTIDAISSYISDISYILGEISNGNLNLSVSREYVGDFGNIKLAMDTIIIKLNDIVGNINSATQQVSSGAKSISESSMTLATGASEQASAVQELTATIDVINEQTQKNTDNSKNANKISETAKKNALFGNSEMTKMLSSMEGIQDSSNKIAKIINTIENIASQINLLALNAAVEAARAGAHGKGFAVVADAVRTLAVRSQTAVKEISVLIDDSTEKVNDGMRVAGSTAHSLETIVHDVNEVSSIISDIAVASVEQENAISQVTVGLGQISHVVQNNSSTSEESASAAEELSSQSETLSNMVSIFTLKKR